jgi:hypothetical protein
LLQQVPAAEISRHAQDKFRKNAEENCEGAERLPDGATL